MKKSILVSLATLVFTSPLMAGTLYTIDEDAQPSSSLYILDANTGSATLVGEVDPSGDLSASLLGGTYDSSTDTLFYYTFFYLNSDAVLASVDQDTGAGTFIGEDGDTSNVFGMAYDAVDDVLYASDEDASPRQLVTVNRQTGVLTDIGHLDSAGNIGGMAHDAATDTLYGVDPTNLYTINQSTGAATIVGTHGVTNTSNTNQFGLAVDPDNGVMYMVDGGTDSLYTVNKDTGEASLIGDTGLEDPSNLAVIPDQRTPTEPIPAMNNIMIAALILLLALYGSRRMASVSRSA